MESQGQKSSSQARRNINLAERKLGIQRVIKNVSIERKGTIWREGKDLELKSMCHFSLCDTRILYYHIIILRASYIIMVSQVLRCVQFLVHISMKDLSKMHKVCYLR